MKTEVSRVALWCYGVGLNPTCSGRFQVRREEPEVRRSPTGGWEPCVWGSKTPKRQQRRQRQQRARERGKRVS